MWKQSPTLEPTFPFEEYFYNTSCHRQWLHEFELNLDSCSAPFTTPPIMPQCLAACPQHYGLEDLIAHEESGSNEQRPVPPPPSTRHPEHPIGKKMHELDPKDIRDAHFRAQVKSAIKCKNYRDKKKDIEDKGLKCKGTCQSE